MRNFLLSFVVNFSGGSRTLYKLQHKLIREGRNFMMLKSQFPRNQANEYLSFYTVATEEKSSGWSFRKRNASDYTSLTRFCYRGSTILLGKVYFATDTSISGCDVPPAPSCPFSSILSLTWDTSALHTSAAFPLYSLHTQTLENQPWSRQGSFRKPFF